jgi:hypothetical protein
MLDVTCFPGPDSTVNVVWVTPEQPELMIYLDPESVTVQLPPFPGGELVLSRFLRVMSREAAKLATELEARRVAGPPPEEPTIGQQIEPQD